MLKVYLYTPVGAELDNADYFRLNTMSLMNGDSDLAVRLRNIAAQFDGCDIISDSPAQFKSKFINMTIFPSQLSLGCQTILNIIAHPDVTFSLIECGINAKDYIYNLKDGNVCDDFITIGKYKQPVQFDYHGSSFIANASNTANKWFREVTGDA